MASTYTAFDSTKPAGSQTGSAFATSANNNDKAAWYAIVQGGSMPGWTLAISGGTNEEPTTYTWSNGTQRVRSTNTWSAGNLTAQTWAASQDSGSTYATIDSQTMTYDAGGNLTATTGAGGMLDVLKYLLGKVKALLASFNAHAALTGASAHGLGTVSTQDANSVAITGGAIDGTAIGVTTPAIGTFLQAREVATSVTFGGASTTVSWTSGGIVTIAATGSGAAALVFSNPPPSGVAGTMVVRLINAGLRTWTWPTNTRWDGGAAPSGLPASGTTIIVFMAMDGAGFNYYASVFGKAFA